MIINDIDRCQTCILQLLDFTAAFYIVDHILFIKHVKHWVGISVSSSEHISTNLGSLSSCIKNQCRNLGVTLDNNLNLDY